MIPLRLAVSLTFGLAGTQPPRQPPLLSLRFEKLYTIGPAPANHLAVGALDPGDIAIDSLGRVLVLDREGQHIDVFARGELAARFGTKGSGPGQLLDPRAIVTTRRGVWARDAKKKVFVGFDLDGKPLADQPLRHVGSIRSVGARESDFLAMSVDGDTARLGLVNDQGMFVIEKVPLPKTRTVTGIACGVIDYGTRPVFTPELLFSARDDVVVINREGNGLIMVRIGASPERPWTLGRSRRPATRGLALAELGSGLPVEGALGGPSCRVPAEVLITAGVADSLPSYRRLLLGPQRRVWAIRFTLPKEPGTADLIDIAKGPVGVVKLGSIRPVAIGEDGTVVSVEQVDEDRSIIVAYRVVPH